MRRIHLLTYIYMRAPVNFKRAGGADGMLLFAGETWEAVGTPSASVALLFAPT